MTWLRPLTAALLLLLAACANDGDAEAATAADADPAAPDASPADPMAQLPPTGAAAIEPWLAAGHYLAWRCEPMPHPARPPGAHGVNRICSNEAMATAPPGAFPAGAASVKELYSGDQLTGWAVSRKLQADSAAGDGWYWYERLGGTTYADDSGVGLCTSCHEDADTTFAPTARDYVFTVVP